MSANQTVDPEEIAELIGRCKLAMSVSEFHGALVGYISAGGSFPHGSVLQALELEPDQPPTKDEQDMLTRLRHQTEEWLADPELTFSPWLPDDDAPIHERAEGLSEWAEGFLGGFGLGGSPGANKNMSDEARELLTDMAGIATTEFEFDKDDDVNDENLTEIEEYVRTGALLLHAEFSRIPRPASDTLH
jgi:uncharacterized protein YgfB (UPF0149 family)